MSRLFQQPLQKLSAILCFFVVLTGMAQDTPSGKLIIFHAGSLSVPFHQIADAFMKEYPQVKVELESAGSVASARKITDLNRSCDIMASADYQVINKMLIPKYTRQNIQFATNEMVIAFTGKSRRSHEINRSNWFRILLDPEVLVGRSDPDSDPCGYRTVMTLKLAAKYYDRPDLAEKLLKKDIRFMRPKEVDLIALLESHNIDYMFIYKSVAVQHRLKYLSLPNEINLGDPRLADLYSTVHVTIQGKQPGETMTMKGEPMVYGITILRDAPNKAAAEAFVKFLLDPEKGGRIMRENGQEAVRSEKSEEKLKIDN